MGKFAKLHKNVCSKWFRIRFQAATCSSVISGSSDKNESESHACEDWTSNWST